MKAANRILGYLCCRRCYKSITWRRTIAGKKYLSELGSTQPHQCSVLLAPPSRDSVQLPVNTYKDK